MADTRHSTLFFPTVILPLAVLWLALRFLFDVPAEITTVVTVILAVAAFFVWNGVAKRSASRPLPRRDERRVHVARRNGQ